MKSIWHRTQCTYQCVWSEAMAAFLDLTGIALSHLIGFKSLTLSTTEKTSGMFMICSWWIVRVDNSYSMEWRKEQGEKVTLITPHLTVLNDLIKLNADFLLDTFEENKYVHVSTATLLISQWAWANMFTRMDRINILGVEKCEGSSCSRTSNTHTNPLYLYGLN